MASTLSQYQPGNVLGAMPPQTGVLGGGYDWSQYGNSPGDIARYLFGKPPITAEQEAQIAAALPEFAPTQMAKGMVGGVADLAMQARDMWSNPTAVGLYPEGQAPDQYENARPGRYDQGQADPSLLVPFGANMAGMATTGSLAAPAVRNATGMGIRAYHGSPHDFDRFSMDKIGTGEGAQAYDLAAYREAAKEWEATGNAEKLRIANKQIEVLERRLQATSNYVVFDDNTINILKKYGLAGLTAGGAGAAMLGGSQDAQAAQPSYSTGGRF